MDIAGGQQHLKVPYDNGFDVLPHMDYIAFVGERALPLATDGWQMFQSPLYYIVSAPLYLLFSAMLSPEGVVQRELSRCSAAFSNRDCVSPRLTFRIGQACRSPAP